MENENYYFEAIMDTFYYEKCEADFQVDHHKIDLYFPELKIAVERFVPLNGEYDRIRDMQIQEKLGCVFFRFNPSDIYFSIFETIGDLALMMRHRTYVQISEGMDFS